MKIRHGTFEDVAGNAVKSNGMIIVPAVVQLHGTTFSSEFPLHKLPAAEIPTVLRVPIQKQYDVGTVSYVSLLTAQQAYAQARLTYVQAFAARYTDTVTLFQSLGGAWWNRADR